MSTADPRLDGLSLKGNWPPHVGEVNPYPDVLGIHNSKGPKSQQNSSLPTAGRGAALTASKLTLFLPSVALRDRQLRSFAHFTPQPSHYGHYSLLTEIIIAEFKR
ncbi:hypothetical protein PIB30_100825, partial [Stylosanthes scabra]|nr:hypothetical protein [Stylosanthes scabra]